MDSVEDKESRLENLLKLVRSCHECELGKTRANPVFGFGSSSAKIMFVGEAPGYHEDQQGIPFVGRAGKLLDQLLERIGLDRSQVYIANVLKCRPPDNRDPLVDEISRCRTYLERQISIIEPEAICTLGNFATKLLTGKPDGISRVHGRPQPCPGFEKTFIYPVYHPAAALYTPSNLRALEHDFDHLPELLSSNTQSQVEPLTSTSDPVVETPEGQADPEQMGLF